jgi:hypothetical protein
MDFVDLVCLLECIDVQLNQVFMNQALRDSKLDLLVILNWVEILIEVVQHVHFLDFES